MTIRTALFRLDLDRPQLAALYGVLDRAEQLRSAEYRFDRDRNRFIARRGQLRRFLAGLTGCKPEDLPIRQKESGKPYLADIALNFSIAHSHDLCLCAVSDQSAIGCDLEHCNPALASPDVVAAFFAQAENNALEQLHGEKRVDGFFQLWTCKEAYLKGTGHGLSLPLDSFTVSLRAGTKIQSIDTAPDWTLCSFQPLPGYWAAIACNDLAPNGFGLQHVGDPPSQLLSREPVQALRG